MGKFKDFVESPTIGCYVSCTYDESIRVSLSDWLEQYIPGALLAEDLHTTILYSRATISSANQLVDQVELIGKTFKPLKLEVFDGKSDAGNPLVLIIDAPTLVTLHELLIANGGTHDYPEYKPHVTLTHLARTIDLSTLKIPDVSLVVTGVKIENLNLNHK